MTDSKSVLNVQSFGTAALLICSIHVVSLELMCNKTPTSFTLEASICALDLRIIPVLLSFCSSVLFLYRRPLDHRSFPQVCCFTASSELHIAAAWIVIIFKLSNSLLVFILLNLKTLPATFIITACPQE